MQPATMDKNVSIHFRAVFPKDSPLWKFAYTPIAKVVVIVITFNLLACMICLIPVMDIDLHSYSSIDCVF